MIPWLPRASPQSPIPRYGCVWSAGTNNPEPIFQDGVPQALYAITQLAITEALHGTPYHNGESENRALQIMQAVLMSLVQKGFLVRVQLGDTGLADRWELQGDMEAWASPVEAARL